MSVTVACLTVVLIHNLIIDIIINAQAMRCRVRQAINLYITVNSYRFDVLSLIQMFYVLVMQILYNTLLLFQTTNKYLLRI